MILGGLTIILHAVGGISPPPSENLMLFEDEDVMIFEDGYSMEYED